MRDIFISYVEENGLLAAQLAAGLEAAGYSVWYYERDGVPGASYLLQTRAAIEDCQAVVLIISPDSVTSEQVTLEVVRAHESQKKFLPLRTDISHAEFVERRPEWAQALGASTSTAVSQENLATVIPRLFAGLRKMNLLPRPELVTKETSVVTAEMIREAMKESSLPPTPSPLRSAAQVTNVVSPPASPAQPAITKPAASKKNLYVIAGAVAVLALLAIAILLWRNRAGSAGDLALTTTPVREEFLNLQAWTHPPNWAVGNGVLELAESPQLGSLANKNFRNFTMSFQVTLLNGEGAAWALRVRERGYYLFYLSGPKGLQPNRFLTYLVQGDKMDQVGTPFNVIRPLQEGGVYTISVKAESNHFFHQIRIDSVPDQQFEGETYKLGEYADAQDTFPVGTIGFRSLANEKFSVSDLFIYPPGTKPLQ